MTTLVREDMTPPGHCQVCGQSLSDEVEQYDDEHPEYALALGVLFALFGAFWCVVGWVLRGWLL